MIAHGALNRHLFGIRLGTIWNEGVAKEARPILRSLLEFSNCSNAYAALQGLPRWLLGDNQEILQKHLFTIDPRQVVQIGADLQQRLLLRAATPELGYLITYRPGSYDLGLSGHAALLTEDAEILSAEDGFYLLFPMENAETELNIRAEDLYPRYVVPFPFDLHPVSLLTSTRTLVVGLDFAQGDGCLVFNESPAVIFPDGKFIAQTSARTRKALLSYTLQLDGCQTSGHHVVRYLRETQSLPAFQLAIAEIAGAVIIPWDATLHEVTTVNGAKKYYFDAGVLTVNYAHTPLTAGTRYSKNTIIGGVVAVHGRQSAGDSWYRALDWGDGLSLDGLCPFKGLRAPDQPCRAFAVAASTDVHVRLSLQGDSEVLARYWEHVRRSELACGKYLNAVVGLTGVSDVKFVNPMEIIFRYLLANRGIAIWLDKEALGPLADKRARDFIAREKPVGSIPLFL